MDSETSLQAQVIKFATQASTRLLIGGIITGIAGFITVCFGIGLYHRPVNDVYGNPVLDVNDEQVYEETAVGNAVLTSGIVVMIFALYCLGGGLLGRFLEPIAKRKNIRRLKIIFFAWALLSLVTAALMCLAIFFTDNIKPIYIVIIASAFLVSLWRICIIFQFARECRDNDYKY